MMDKKDQTPRKKTLIRRLLPIGLFLGYVLFELIIEAVALEMFVFGEGFMAGLSFIPSLFGLIFMFSLPLGLFVFILLYMKRQRQLIQEPTYTRKVATKEDDIYAIDPEDYKL